MKNIFSIIWGLLFYSLPLFSQEVEDVKNRSHSNLFFDQAKELYDKERFSEALNVYDKAIELDSFYATAYNNRGNCKFKLNDLQHDIRIYYI